MRKLTQQEADILHRHQRWLETGGKDGARADLRDAVLTGADLRDAVLTGAVLRGAVLTCADLTGADLDFSSWPLHCGSCNAKVGDRIVAQLLFHVARLDVSGCSGGVREAIDHIRAMAISDLFCEYRDDVKELGVFGCRG